MLAFLPTSSVQLLSTARACGNAWPFNATQCATGHQRLCMSYLSFLSWSAGAGAIQPSTPELDFGPEDATLNEVSPPQSVTFTNQASSPVQILSAMAAPPCGIPGSLVTLSRPANPGGVPGLQVVTGLNLAPPSIQYVCDVDITSQKANFQIISDGCSGTLLARQSCRQPVMPHAAA